MGSTAESSGVHPVQSRLKLDPGERILWSGRLVRGRYLASTSAVALGGFGLIAFGLVFLTPLLAAEGAWPDAFACFPMNLVYVLLALGGGAGHRMLRGIGCRRSGQPCPGA